MKKLIAIISAFVLFITAGIVIDCTTHTDVLIYASMEDFRLEELRHQLNEHFQDYDIEVQYVSTGQSASKVKGEGENTYADIVLDLEYAYCVMLQENFASLSSVVDSGMYDQDLLISDKFLPNAKLSVGVAINTSRLAKLGLPIPRSYADLLNPIYAGEIIMPSPKASGTGYSFLLAMLNLYGEEDGWKYFEELDKNIKMYSTSGGGSISSLSMGECSIAIGMVSQVIIKKNSGANIELLTMDEGNAYNLTGNAIIKGKESNPKVVEVFKYIQNEFVLYEKQHFLPENIYNTPLYGVTLKEYPQNIKYMDMSGGDDIGEKERILGLWKY